MALSISLQDYLETILFLDGEHQEIRSVDVASRLHVSRAAVSKSLMLLKDLKLIEMQKYGLITLTSTGRLAAQQVMDKHLLLSSFLIVLGVDPTTAGIDACKIEHVLSDASVEKIKDFMTKQ